MFITPNWPAPKQVKALCTTRKGGVSLPPFDTLNLAQHVGDNPNHVKQNRERFFNQAKLPSEPMWLDQQHTDVAIELGQYNHQKNPPPIADASWTTQKGCVSIVMTADCLPLLITNKQGTLVSAIHAGWKGLHLGIVSKTIGTFLAQERGRTKAQDLLVWIGPAIRAKHFEVGQDVLNDFVKTNPENKRFFTESTSQNGQASTPKYLADLIGIVQQELKNLGVTDVFGGDLCTYAQPEQFYSYRRSGKTGRIASCIWMELC